MRITRFRRVGQRVGREGSTLVGELEKGVRAVRRAEWGGLERRRGRERLSWEGRKGEKGVSHAAQANNNRAH